MFGVTSTSNVAFFSSNLSVAGPVTKYGVSVTSNVAFFSSNLTVAGPMNVYGVSSTSNAAFYSSNLTVTGPVLMNVTCWVGSNAANNKVLVLSDQSPTDALQSATAFYGLGYNTNVLRYQAGTSGSHKWYTGSTNTLTIDSTGNVIAAANITAYSDVRLKTDIVRIPDALDKIDMIGGYTFTRKDMPTPSGRCAGVLAQEVHAVLPEAVHKNEWGMLSVSHGSVVGLLVEGIREMRIQIGELKKLLRPASHACDTCEVHCD
jgi:hypothetical protein